jgi:intracellular sulfur oxidation DsrE/DsrF family protein
MNIIKLALILITLSITGLSYGQQKENNSNFTGAIATLKEYKALYILNQSDEKKIKGVLRNINNALEDPRLKGKLTIEFVVFGEGVELFKKVNHYDTALLKLYNKGVILAQCLNTIREKKISKDELWPFIAYVPSGNGEIIIRQQQGWATVHP